MPFAILSFTGNDHFNRSMRSFAHTKGLSLSDHGLVPCVRAAVGGAMERISAGKQNAECARGVVREEDVFTALGLVYVPPEARSI